jgi:hypothetical protein
VSDSPCSEASAPVGEAIEAILVDIDDEESTPAPASSAVPSGGS